MTTTASLTPSPTAAETSPTPVPRGTHRSVLRLHRTTLWAALALTVLALAVTGYLRLAHEGRPGLIRLLGLSNADDLLHTYLQRGSVALLFVPLAVAAFTAGPLVARELEAGLHKFAWTQGDSPARWLGARLTVAAVLAVAAGLAVLAVFWVGGSGLVHAVGDSLNLGWSDGPVYAATGPVAVAYCLLAAAVGALAGLLVRRTLLAMSAAGAVTGAVLWLLSSVRWDLFPVRTATGSSARERANWFPGDVPADNYVMDQGVTNAAGERFAPGQCLPDQPAPSCPADTRVVEAWADFHPRSHFWYVQLIETGIVLALAAAAVYAGFWLLRRRTP
ncbi:ABC transporter permease [Streptomyces aureoverticillatus]|uniref:ABC transporter permease n=1 Tax=Streptomyces aureoverticillatus TaxID=66871 RepID=UPI0013DC4660|nr:ABC transporter permease [Streptomyces aureoverticillatus]QIB44969.1 ABC transporter permease [Streptomyces aureoverticillatus]